MSFSSKVKNELARTVAEARHCQLAEIAAMIHMCGHVKKEGDLYGIRIQTENPSVAKKYFILLKKAFNMNTQIVIRKNVNLHKNRYYIVNIQSSEDAIKVLKATKILVRTEEGDVLSNRINPILVRSRCCKRAYIRGSFLGGGSVSDPEKNYHLEFVNGKEEHCEDLKEMVASFDLQAKMVMRKRYFILYLKDGPQIVDMFNIMGAHKALMDLENVRIIKEMRNNVNRIVNCETANLNKTVSAAVKQVEDITYIQQRVGLESLPDNLREIALVRLEYTDASLKELGTMLDPVVGKSGVNHRLRKISTIADELRAGK